MSKTFISRSPKIIGAYLSELGRIAPSQNGETFWTTDGQRFLPLVKLFSLAERSDLTLANIESPANDIETYNSKDPHYSLSRAVVTNKRMDVSAGDLTIGSTRMVLNFTDQPVVMKTRSDIPKMFLPLRNEQLRDWYNKVMVLSFHSFNVPSTIREISGITNYFENLRIERIQRGEGKSTTTKMLEFLSQCWQSFNPDVVKTLTTNSIKLVMVHEYLSADFMQDGKEVADLYCTESGLHFRRTSNILELPTHPKHNDTLIANRQIVETMRDNGISCFIVDNHDRIGDRYINFAGQVRLVPKSKSPNQLDGLYIASVNGSKSLDSDSFTPLEAIDECPYVYKSQEEALQGADRRMQAQQEFELNKLGMSMEATQMQQELIKMRHQFEQEALRVKAESEERVRRIELENKQRQIAYDERLREMDLRHQSALKEFKLQEESNKLQTSSEKFRFDLLGMENKHRYEVEKYGRDSTVETLKTIGSVAGLLAGGYVIYKQLSKS